VVFAQLSKARVTVTAITTGELSSEDKTFKKARETVSGKKYKKQQSTVATAAVEVVTGYRADQLW